MSSHGRAKNKNLISLASALVLGSTLPARAQNEIDAPHADPGKNCLGESRGKKILGETLVGLVNPLGSEHQLTFGYCSPLITESGLLFDYTNFQVGLFNYLAPVYMHQGAFVSIAPLSVLELRAEAAGVAMWPFPFDAAGYYPLSGYGAKFDRVALPRTSAGTAGGFTAALAANFRVQFELFRHVSLVALNSFSEEYWFIGTAGYYYNLRRDLVLARSDVLMKETAALLLQIELPEGWALRVGATDDLTFVHRSGYKANVVAGLAMLLLKNWRGSGNEVGLFVRSGGYTHHAFRTGFQGLAGLYGTFEVLRPNGAARLPPPP